MKLNKWYTIEIMRRFMSEEELEEFQQEYNEAKLLAIADRTLGGGEKKHG